jgi:hypothetical protein
LTFQFYVSKKEYFFSFFFFWVQFLDIKHSVIFFCPETSLAKLFKFYTRENTLFFFPKLYQKNILGLKTDKNSRKNKN